MVRGARRSGRCRPGEQRPPPSWNGRNLWPTRTDSVILSLVAGVPIMALSTSFLVCRRFSVVSEVVVPVIGVLGVTEVMRSLLVVTYPWAE